MREREGERFYLVFCSKAVRSSETSEHTSTYHGNAHYMNMNRRAKPKTCRQFRFEKLCPGVKQPQLEVGRFFFRLLPKRCNFTFPAITTSWSDATVTGTNAPVECLGNTPRIRRCVGRDSAVGIATRYGLDGPGIESRCGRDFTHPSRQALRPTQPPIQWVLGLCRV